MKLSKKRITILVVLLAFLSLICFFVLPIADRTNKDLRAYETRIAYRDNYRLHTTPLTNAMVDDICSKLNIKETSENCQPSAVVYAPDFFNEIKSYFNSLPDQDKTYATVQDRLGKYLVSCEKPDPNGNYLCEYDIRGDEVYPVSFYFNEKDFYFRIFANIGGS